MSEEMERLKEIEARKEELRSEAANETTAKERLEEIRSEAQELSNQEKEVRTRMDIAENLKEGTVPAPTARGTVNEREQRANDFVKTGRMEMRQLLSTGNIAKPASVENTVNGLGEVASDIVDDVHAIQLTGTGSWTAAYKLTDAEAAAVTDGSAVAGTASTYHYVTISPSEWGVLDEISKQVKKMSPVDYLGAIEDSALIALRDYASNAIVTAVTASSLAKAVTATIDQDYLKTVILGFRAIKGKGGVCLYLAQSDLLLLGKVRGTNEKKALYDIKFDEGSTTAGVISEGGLATRFRVLDQLSSGTQLFGQPGTIDMPMWDGYTVETDEGGDYFKRNMIGIKGLQTAGADLVAKYGMHVITNSAS